jgi:peptide/nickel transport system ATP-binding protein
MTTSTEDNMNSLLKISNLEVSLGTKYKPVKIIRGFDLYLEKGEIVGVLGESGSGKTVSSRMIAGLFEKDESSMDAGEILFKGKDLSTLSEKEMNLIRGREIAYVFQDPTMSLNPYKKVGKQLRDFLDTHGIEYTTDSLVNTLNEVGINRPETVLEMFPFQLSGGQNQRIMICQAILGKPDLLIADEPTSSIDAMLRKKILDLLIDINRKYGMAIIFITHDFDVAKYICDKLVIMYGGLMIEQGPLERILGNPMHPYSDELIKCASSLDSGDSRLYSLEGSPLVPSQFKDECPFYNRCAYRIDSCLDGIPKMVDVTGGSTRCPIWAERGKSRV